MVYLSIPKPSPADIVYDRARKLVRYFGKKYPRASIKIEIEYHSGNKYCICHDDVRRLSDGYLPKQMVDR